MPCILPTTHLHRGNRFFFLGKQWAPIISFRTCKNTVFFFWHISCCLVHWWSCLYNICIHPSHIQLIWQNFFIFLTGQCRFDHWGKEWERVEEWVWDKIQVPWVTQLSLSSWLEYMASSTKTQWICKTQKPLYGHNRKLFCFTTLPSGRTVD